MDLTATWLTIFGASLSAFWILIANAWMQHPVGMEFNPDTVRNEMVDFWALLSPFALNKFFHTVVSSWIVGSLFVLGVSAWYLVRKREIDFAKKSIKVAAVFGLVASLLTLYSGDGSAYHVAQKQPMKLAAMEGLYQGQEGAELVAIGILNPEKKNYNDSINPYIFKIGIPKALSFLGYRDANAFVPGIMDIIEGGYQTKEGLALSFAEKREKGIMARQALADYKIAKKNNDSTAAAAQKAVLDEHFSYFGYSYLEKPEESIPNVPQTFYAFHLMVMLGMYFIALFALFTFLSFSKKIDVEKNKLFLWLAVLSVPLGYVSTQLGWLVAEFGRQPWAIQDLLPLQASISAISVQSVIITVSLFTVLFTALLLAELKILAKQIKKGPQPE